MTVKVSFSGHLHISRVSGRGSTRGGLRLISAFPLVALEPARLSLRDTRLYTHLIKLNRVGLSRGGVFARARSVSSAPGGRAAFPVALPGARGASLPAPPPAPRPRRDGAGPAAGAQDAVGPHKRFVFTTSFRSLSGLPATIKGQVCSQEKTRVGRGLPREECTSPRRCRQRARLGSAPGDRAPIRAQRGWGRGSRRWLRRGAFGLSPAAEAASPPSRAGLPPGVLGVAEPVRSAAGGRREGGKEGGGGRGGSGASPAPRHSRRGHPAAAAPPPAFARARRGGSAPREPPHAAGGPGTPRRPPWPPVARGARFGVPLGGGGGVCVCVYIWAGCFTLFFYPILLCCGFWV